MESNDEELKLKLPCDCNDSEEVVSEEEEESDIAEEQEPLLVEEEKLVVVVEEEKPLVVEEENPVVVEEQIIIDFAKEPEQTQPQQQTKQYINSILKSVSCIFKRFNFFR
jgi:c-di-AMP phosphodiesterase-like protein